MKGQFERECKRLRLANVAIRTAFLEHSDYLSLIGSADVGVSMHASSSGLDLPMKAVDMLGCGVPVLSKTYSAIRELVCDGQNGLLFDGADALSSELSLLFCSKGGQVRLRSLREGVHTAEQAGWDDEWDRVVLPSLSLQSANSW